MTTQPTAEDLAAWRAGDDGEPAEDPRIAEAEYARDLPID